MLHPDRYFDSDPTKRQIAREIYEEIADLPIVSPHGHVDPALLVKDEAFPEPTSLIITPDHYIFRMLYSRGVSLEELGIPRRDGQSSDGDPRRVWQIFADHYYLFRGTPTGVWLDYEMHELFGVDEPLNSDSAMRVYDAILDRLQEPGFRPRALFDEFNIEVLCTTDAATDDLVHHRAIRESDWDGDVRPTFRPDAVINIAADGWSSQLDKLREVTGMAIDSFQGYIEAIEERRAFFKEMGATATDHAVLTPRTHRLDSQEAESLFQKALDGTADAADQEAFAAHMLMEMARMSSEDGLVMQIHPGAYRNHNRPIFQKFGPDKGGDIPLQTEYTRNLEELLNAYGNEPDLTIVLFTLDESTYARELAPLAGHYPALKLGPPWWFHDSIEGMLRFRRQTTETAGIYNTAGFTDDTRAFCSIPARHDLARRIDARYLAGLVATHVVDMDGAMDMARALTYDLPLETYNLPSREVGVTTD